VSSARFSPPLATMQSATSSIPSPSYLWDPLFFLPLAIRPIEAIFSREEAESFESRRRKEKASLIIRPAKLQVAVSGFPGPGHPRPLPLRDNGFPVLHASHVAGAVKACSRPPNPPNPPLFPGTAAWHSRLLGVVAMWCHDLAVLSERRWLGRCDQRRFKMADSAFSAALSSIALDVCQPDTDPRNLPAGGLDRSALPCSNPATLHCGDGRPRCGIRSSPSSRFRPGDSQTDQLFRFEEPPLEHQESPNTPVCTGPAHKARTWTIRAPLVPFLLPDLHTRDALDDKAQLSSPLSSCGSSQLGRQGQGCYGR
jgi:hypothetical protein